MLRIRDVAGVVHYVWSVDTGITLPPVTYCLEGTRESVYTEDDVDCSECLSRVARFQNRELAIGDMVYYDGVYAALEEIDPTYALFLFHRQDGLKQWEVPIGIPLVKVKPSLYWRLHYQVSNKIVFWVGPSFTSARGSVLKGQVLPQNTKLIRNPIDELIKLLKVYTYGKSEVS